MATATKVIIELSRTSDKMSRVLDITSLFQAGAAQTYVGDFSGWDVATVQIVSPSGTMSFNTTNDNGSTIGVLPPTPVVPANWTAVQGVNVGTGTSVTSVAATAMVKFVNFGKFFQIV